jgi:hypothetical protein
MRLPLSLLLAPVRAFVASMRVSAGRWRLLRGDPEGAARHFEAAAALHPDAFAPYLHLARARLRRRETFQARRALALARTVDSARYAREAEVWVRREGFDLGLLTDVPPVPEPPARETAVMRSRGRSAAGLPFGDCKDLDEYSRFQAMPPITPGEISSLDWDSVADDLQDG